MDSHMAGPMCVKLSGVVGGCRVGDLGQKKIQIENFVRFFFGRGHLTLYDLCMCDDSLGFEDCCLATHLLNLWKMHRVVSQGDTVLMTVFRATYSQLLEKFCSD